MKSGHKIMLIAGMDAVIIGISIALAFIMRFELNIPSVYIPQMFIFIAVAIASCLVLMFFSRMYHRVWRYASIGEMFALFRSVTLGFVFSFVLISLIFSQRIPLLAALYAFQSSFLLMGGTRFMWRIVRDRYIGKRKESVRVLIVGAGDCGVMIAKDMKFSASTSLQPVAFIDDDPHKQGQQILGIPVAGNSVQIAASVKQLQIDMIVLAIPSVGKKDKRRLIDLCKDTSAKVKIMPPLTDMMNLPVSVKQIRDVQVEDLLGREPVKLDMQHITSYITGKTVLVTGAGGSIGSELCRQIIHLQPERLLLLGHGENSIYTIHKELERLNTSVPLETLIIDIQDAKRMEQIFRSFKPEVVFHAAAHKHVPLMEANPLAAIKNNVFGTKITAECADRHGAERFILISTDKAVNPTSVMGTTKRVAEMIIQTMNQKSKTEFAAVRFGNVLGSRGSVIPHFKEQIAYGGPVTVTDPEMVRYFMTIPEAVQLVMQAGSLAKGGEVFVLDMGEPVKIVKLAEDLIRLSGFEPYADIDIKFTGIRPGEKLYEELLLDDEGIKETSHERIFIGKPLDIKESKLTMELNRLEMLIGKPDDNGQVPVTLKNIVPAYVGVG